jgi:AraC-like DNA-binding protein
MITSSKIIRPRGPSEPKLDLAYLRWGRRSLGKGRPQLLKRSEWAYVLMRTGKATLVTPEASFKLKPGDFAIIDPNCSRKWTSLDRTGFETLTWRWRSKPFYAPLTPSYGEHVHWKLSEDACKGLERLHRLSKAEIQRADQFAPDALANIHRALDLCLMRAIMPSPAQKSAKVQFELATEWFNSHTGLRHPIASLSEYLNVSTMTLHRLFLRHAKQSPWHYFQNLKMRKATEMLASRKYNIKEVGYQMGYRFPCDFSRAYKSLTGKNPVSLLKRTIG